MSHYHLIASHDERFMDPMECLTYPIPNPKAISLGRQDSTAWYSRVRQLLDSLEPSVFVGDNLEQPHLPYPENSSSTECTSLVARNVALKAVAD